MYGRGAKFSIREYPSPANFFSVDILIVATEQRWCLFVPIDAPMEQLLHCWDSLPKYDQRPLLGEWIVKYTDMEIHDGMIVGAQFDHHAFTQTGEKELRRFLHLMVVRIQALMRGVHCRAALRRAHHLPLQYDRSFYTTSAIAKMRPKVPYPKQPAPPPELPFDEAPGDTVHHPPASPRRYAHSPTRCASPIHAISPGKCAVSTAPHVTHQGRGDSYDAFSSHDWLESVEAARSVTAGDMPRRRPQARSSRKAAHGNGRPHGISRQWPSKISPREQAAVINLFHRKKQPRVRGHSAAPSSTRRAVNSKQSASSQDKLHGVMALYVSAPGTRYHRSLESSIGSHISQMYEELQSLQMFHDPDADEFHFPHVSATGQASISMEYISLFDTPRDPPQHASMSIASPSRVNRSLASYSRRNQEPSRGTSSTGGSAVRYIDSMADRSTTTDGVYYSEAQSYRTVGVDGDEEGNDTNCTKGRDDDIDTQQDVMIGSSALAEENSIDSDRAPPVQPTYVFHESDILDSNGSSLWNGSVSDNMYWPMEGSLANSGRKPIAGSKSRASKTDYDQGYTKYDDPNHLHPGDYKLLVDYRDIEQRKAWIRILRFLTVVAQKFLTRQWRSIYLRDMQTIVEARHIRDAMVLSIQSGDIELATQTLNRIHTIIQSHATGHTVIASSFNPTLLSNLSLFVDTVFAFLSIDNIASTAVDVLSKLSSISNVGDLYEVIGMSGALNLIIAMWSRYGSDTTRTILLIKLSNKLCAVSSTNRSRLFSVANCTTLGRLLVRYMASNHEALQRLARFVCKAGTRDHRVMDNCGRSCLYRSLVDGISDHQENRIVLQTLCKCVAVLCSVGHTPTQTYFGTAEVCSTFVQLLKDNQCDSNTYRSVVSTIICMCSKHSQNMTNLAHCELPQFLMSILSDASLDNEVLRCTISLLFHLSSHDPLKDGLIAMGLDRLLTDIGMKYDIKRTLGSLKKHGDDDSLEKSSQVDSAAVAIAQRAQSPDQSQVRQTRVLDDSISQATLDELSQMRFDENSFPRVSSKPRARSFGNVLGAPAMRDLSKESLFKGKKEKESGDDAKDDTSDHELQAANQTVGKVEPFSPTNTAALPHDEPIAPASTAESKPPDTEGEGSRRSAVEVGIAGAASAAVGSIIRTASDKFTEKYLASMADEAHVEEKRADEDECFYPPSLVIGDRNDDMHDDGTDELVPLGTTDTRVRSPTNCVVTSPTTIDGDYILDCLGRAVDLSNEGLAVKSLKSVNSIVEKDAKQSCMSSSEAAVLNEIKENPMILLRVLTSFLKSTRVQNIGIWVLRNMNYDDDIVTSMVAYGVCDTLYSVMQEHVYNDEICGQAIDYMAFMSHHRAAFGSAAGSMGYCKILMSIMSRIVVSNVSLMCACCMYTRVLAAKHVDNLCRSGVAGLVVKFLIAHKQDPEIVHICAETIIALTEAMSDTALSCLGSHKHLRLYVHVIRVNDRLPSTVNVMANLIVLLSAHKGNYNFAAETERSGIVVDLINVLRRAIVSTNSTSIYTLHTSLLLMVHILCNISSMAKLLRTGGGDELLRSLLSFDHVISDRAEAVRDLALAGLQHMLTPLTRDSSGAYNGRAGVVMDVKLDAVALYAYTIQYGRHVSAINTITYDVDHGPYPNQPDIEMPDISPPQPIAPTPIPSPRMDDIEEGMTSVDRQLLDTCTSPLDTSHTSPILQPALCEFTSNATSPFSPRAQEERQHQDRQSKEATAGDETSTAVSTHRGNEGTATSTGQRVEKNEKNLTKETEESAEETDRIMPLSQVHTGLLHTSNRASSPVDVNRPGSRSQPASPKIRKSLSGNSLLRVLQTATDVEFIVENLERAASTKDHILGVNVLNRVLQILALHVKESATTGEGHPLAQAIVERPALITNIVMTLMQDKDIMIAAVTVLSKLPLTTEDMERFVGDGLMDVIHTVLKEHHENADAFVRWTKLATKFTKQSSAIRVTAGKGHGCQAVSLLLHAVLHEKSMALSILTYVYTLCDDCVKNQGLFARTGIGSTVVKFLIDHKKDPDVVKRCIQVIDCLCAGNVELNMKVLSSQRHLRLYMKILRSNAANTVVVQSTCGLIITICSGTSQYVSSELSSGNDVLVADMVSLLQDATHDMSKFKDEAVQALLAVISHWTHQVSVLKTALVQSSDLIATLGQFSPSRWSPVTMHIVNELVRYYEVYK